MSSPRATLRVLTLNAWNVSEPFAERMAVARAGIAALAPDVIGLQEIIVRRDGFDQAALLLDGLGYEWVFAPAFRWDDLGRGVPVESDGDAFGNVIASRWPIVAHARRGLPGDETGERRCAVAAHIETPRGTLAFGCTHLNWRFDHGIVRERQVAALDGFMSEWREGLELPPIIVGDLNAEPGSTEIRYLTGLAALDGHSTYYQDAWAVAGNGPGYTWDNRNPFAAMMFEPNRRIDYVLVGLADIRGRGWIERVSLAFDHPAGDAFASDHFGVVADVGV